MTPGKLLPLLVLLFAPYCLGQVSPNTVNQSSTSLGPVFSIAVDPPTAPIRLGSPVNITVTVTNISGKEIYWASDRGKDSTYKAFAFLLMKNGREVETTWFYRKITGRNRADDPPEIDDGNSITLPHPPGKIFVIPIDLTRLYEIKDPGLYTLDVSRFDEYSKTMVRSKAVTLTIMP